jgi:hypothetical protein
MQLTNISRELGISDRRGPDAAAIADAETPDGS